MIVHHDAAALVEDDPRVARYLAVGAHADGEDHQIRSRFVSAFQFDGDLFAVVFKGGDRISQPQRYAVVADVFVQQLRHLEIDRSHHLIEGLDQRDGKPRVTQVFRHFQTDEAAADHRGGFDVTVLYKSAQFVGIRHGPKGADAGAVDAGNGGTQRGGTGGDHQIVVAFLICLAGLRILYSDGLFLSVDGRRFAVDAHVDLKAFPHQLRRHQQQGVSAADHVAHVVGQAAVGVRNVLSTLQDHDLPVRVKPAKSCRAAGASGYPSDNHCFFHNRPPDHMNWDDSSIIAVLQLFFCDIVTQLTVVGLVY